MVSSIQSFFSSIFQRQQYKQAEAQYEHLADIAAAMDENALVNILNTPNSGTRRASQGFFDRNPHTLEFLIAIVNNNRYNSGIRYRAISLLNDINDPRVID